MQRASFDNYAFTYDDHFTNSLIGKAQREIVHTYLHEWLADDLSVLEVNCGTGEDAAFIASRSKNILATDISSEMVAIARQKTASFKNAEVHQVAIEKLSESVNSKFSMIFSNFGGLNCLDQVEMVNFSKTCASLSEDKTELVFVVMGRKCLWERLYFWIKGDKEKRKRRSRKDGVKTQINGAEFFTYYYSPMELYIKFEEEYNVVSLKPVGIFIPPSYLESFFSKHKAFFSILKWLDKLFRNNESMANYADHYLIHMVRK